MRGRPIRRNGDVVLAPLAHRLGRAVDPVVAHLRTSAQDEHSSVAAFASLSLQLFELGAPLRLLDAAARAQRDEVRHAQLMLGLLGTPMEFESVRLGSEPTHVEQMLNHTLSDGCFNEQIAASIALRVAQRSSNRTIAEAYGTIAEDEARHAALAWDMVEWILAQHTLRSIAVERYRDQMQRYRGMPPPFNPWLTEAEVQDAISQALDHAAERGHNLRLN